MARKARVSIKGVEIWRNHVHLFVSSPPQYSPALLVNIFKGISAYCLRRDFPHLRTLRSEDLWTLSYYAGTAEAASAETIRRYVEEPKDLRVRVYGRVSASTLSLWLILFQPQFPQGAGILLKKSWIFHKVCL